MNILEIGKLLANKDALAERIKTELPPLLDVMLDMLAEQAGAAPGSSTSITFIMANTASGPKRMAKVQHVDAFGEPIATVNVLSVADTIKSIPNAAIKAILPF